MTQTECLVNRASSSLSPTRQREFPGDLRSSDEALARSLAVYPWNDLVLPVKFDLDFTRVTLDCGPLGKVPLEKSTRLKRASHLPPKG